MKRSILFSAFVSFALAQQRDYGGDGGYYQDYGDYAGGQGDNLYANYAARQQAGGQGWGKLILASAGGYLLGANIHTSRLKKSVPKLRFKLKQRVECNMGGGTKWLKGTIISLWPQQTKGQWVPYEVQLDDGRKTYAPLDHDMTIRAIRTVKKNKKKKK